MVLRSVVKFVLCGGVAIALAACVSGAQGGEESVSDFVTVFGEPETAEMWSSAPAPENPLRRRNRGYGSRGFAHATGTPAYRDGPNCPDGEACFWRDTNFNGNKISVEGNSTTCCDWKYVSGLEDWWESAKNRHGNRKLQLGTEFNVIACIGPGGERDNPGIYDRARIGSAGSDC
jgi:hypothetical protein